MSKRLIAIAHPGYFIGEEIEARGWTQKQFADVLQISKYDINRLVNGKKNIDAHLAIRIGAALGTNPKVRLGMQNDYDLFILSQSVSQTEYNTILKKVNALELAYHQER